MTSATEVVQQTTRAMMGTRTGGDKNSVAIETVGNGAPPPSQAAPRSDVPASESAGTQPENSATRPADSANELKPNVPADSNELKPNTPADSNELKPNVSDGAGTALPPPQQMNEIQPGQSDQPVDAQAGDKSRDTASSSSQQKDDDETISSSKKKKKKGLKKIVPF